jgi:hypothetical protein
MHPFLKTYNESGYIVRRKMLYPDDIALVLEEFTRMNIFTWKDNAPYVAGLSSAAKLASVYNLFRCKYLLGTVKELGIEIPIIHAPVLHVMSDFKIKDGYNGAAAHQDWPSVQGSLNLLTVWIPLTEVTKDNYPLEVIPGSHKQGIRDGRLNGSVLEIDCDDKDFIPLECNPGDVVFLSGFTIHRTGKGKGFRAAVSQRFDNAGDPAYAERGYPCAQKRIVDREIKWRPTIEQVHDIFN